MVTPTTAQRRVLEAMTGGRPLHEVLHRDGTSSVFLGGEGLPTDKANCVAPSVLYVLYRHGWIVIRRETPGGGGIYEITPPGRAALKDRKPRRCGGESRACVDGG